MTLFRMELHAGDIAADNRRGKVTTIGADSQGIRG